MESGHSRSRNRSREIKITRLHQLPQIARETGEPPEQLPRKPQYRVRSCRIFPPPVRHLSRPGSSDLAQLRHRLPPPPDTALAVPRVAELLADSPFHPLGQWLLQRQVPIGDLQAAVDQLLDQARQTSLEQP